MPNEPQNTGGQQFSDIHHSHVGPILGVLIVVLILILGGLYLWGSMLSENNEARVERTIPNNEPETPRATADAQILNTTSSSNDLDAIYADLESTDLSSLESELGQVDTEMEAAYR